MVKYKFYRLNVIFRFTPIFYNMYMDGSVVVRIEHKSKTKYYKQCRHNSNIICILCNNAANIQTIIENNKLLRHFLFIWLLFYYFHFIWNGYYVFGVGVQALASNPLQAAAVGNVNPGSSHVKSRCRTFLAPSNAITCLWHCGMRHRGGRTVMLKCL